MSRFIGKILLRAFGIVAASFALALSANALRPGGIPIVAPVPYDIFAPCRDSEAKVESVCAQCLAGKTDVLYLDARPAEEFAAGHVEGALNVPYSVLQGASDDDVEKVRREAKARGLSALVVYGALQDPESTDGVIDLAKPLAEQLFEAGLSNARHYEGSLDELKKSAPWKVQGGAP
ncbi:MAG: rhodanese-like domain-containing protein [Myxococcota bacterium]|jgi:hypothetical protein|nr:rhodanese-like domain-containing protein [Myxococcota bacterium]